MLNQLNPADWDVQKARLYYKIAAWSEAYFDVNERGHIVARCTPELEIDLYDLVDQFRERGLSFPILLRLPQILDRRIKRLQDAFALAISNQQYAGAYLPLYPIKVNQQRTVVEHILDFDRASVGLEVGSKSELIAALGLMADRQGTILCNGYKDRTYLRLALIGQRMGLKLFLVIEKISELDDILQEADDLDIQPQLGVRVRLGSVANGRWQNSGGERSKFGLRAEALLQLVERLKQEKLESHLSLLHFHMGSQISSLSDFQTGLREAMRVYALLRASGIPLNFLDVGGGLGVNYDGSHSQNYFSMAYSIEEYAALIVKEVQATCQQEGFEPPTIMTENGRAMTAHHAVLLTNVLDAEVNELDSLSAREIDTLPAALRKAMATFESAMAASDASDASDGWNEQASKEYWQHLERGFVEGEIDLYQRSLGERFYYSLLSRAQTIQAPTKTGFDAHPHEERLADKYFVNLSVFQSLPDIWGLSQIFPIVPIHRLEQAPTRDVRLHDLTCDSDGQIQTYVNRYSLGSVLSLHALEQKQQYVLGFFLVGAYQEILGDMHNLFGDTHAVNAQVDTDGHVHLTDVEVGDTVGELLRDVHLDTAKLYAACVDRLSQCGLSEEKSKQLEGELAFALRNYSYLDSLGRLSFGIKEA